MSRYTAPLRDLATGRVRDYQHRIDRFDEPAWRRYGLLIDTAFRLAAHRRFRPGHDRAPVIRFVASVRERYDQTGYELDPRLAESLLWATLDGEPTPDPMHASSHTAQTLLLIGLLDDEGLSRAELDRFLADAESDAETTRRATTHQHETASPHQVVGEEGDRSGEEANQEGKPGGPTDDHPELASDDDRDTGTDQVDGHRPSQR